MTPARSQLQRTARAYHRVLKISRTISDLVGSEAITHALLAEVLEYRPMLELVKVNVCGFLLNVLPLV